MADFDPTTLSQQLATAYTQGARNLLASQSQTVQATATGLGKLQSALKAFDLAVTAMSGKKSVLQRSAAFANPGYGTATAGATALPGTYSFFVERLASNHQLAFQSVPVFAAVGAGSLGVQLADGSNLTVNLALADADANGSVSQTELARAINGATGNPGKVTASLVTSGGQTRLLLTAGHGGTAGAITLDTSAVGAGALKASLDAATELAPAQDAVVWLGAQGTGLRIEQDSNTFTGIDGVSLQFVKAMAPGDAPLVLDVAADDSGTAANVKSFVDAYNVLEKALDELTLAANEKSGTSAAPFATDPSIRALRNKLASSVRLMAGGLRLGDFGISSDRQGNMTLDNAKLAKGLAAHPDGLDALFGQASAISPTGVLGALDGALTAWTRSGNGQITLRRNSLDLVQKSIAQRQAALDDRYQQMVTRYLNQFTQLKALQASMSETGSLFTNLGSSTS